MIRTRRPVLTTRSTPTLAEQLEQRSLFAAPFAAGHTIVEIDTTYGNIWMEMLDDVAPQTVTNFLRYVDANRYDGTFMHRHARDFVVQLGGYKLGVDGAPDHIEEFTTVPNEYNLSNVKYTVAMAKKGSGPDTATSEFFFNLADNSSNLNNQNGGFTVFANVVNGWDVIETIRDLSLVNAGGAFDVLPIADSWDGTEDITNEHLVVVEDVRRITNPGWSQEALGTAPVRGAGSAAGQSVFVTVNEIGRPIAFHQASSTAPWLVSDIGLQSTSPTLAGNISAWFDTKDNTFHAAAPTAAGLILYTRDADGYWSLRNLTTEISGSAVISSDLVVFKSADNLWHVAGSTSTGNLVLFKQTAASLLTGALPPFQWEFLNISTTQLENNGQTTPTFVGGLTSYVTSWNGLNIVGVDSTGDIQVVWTAPDQARWRTDNLSDLTGAPAVAGTLTAYVSSWDGLNLAATNSAGNLFTTWWAPDRVGLPNGGWTSTSLTDLVTGPALVSTSVSSYVTSWGGLNVTGLDTQGEIVVYWWAPDRVSLPNGGWTFNSISDVVTGGTNPVQMVTGVSSASGEINLMGRASDGRVLRHSWSPADPVWRFQDLSTLATFF